MAFGQTLSASQKRRNCLVAAALLVVVLAVLAALYLILWHAPDYAAPFAALVLLATGGGVWVVGRRNGNFARWRHVFAAGIDAEQARQDHALANPELPQVKRQIRLFGLLMVGAGLLLAAALAAAVWLGDLRVYAYIIVIPLAVTGVGLWLVITGRQPRRRGRRCGGE